MLESIKKIFGKEKKPLESTYLVQRLKMPGYGQKAENAEAEFKKGLFVDGEKLSSEAMSVFKSLWIWDFMGAAEFEFGSIPKSLRVLARSDFSIWEVSVPLSSLTKPHLWGKQKYKTREEQEIFFHVVGPAEYKEEINGVILEVCKGKRLKERSYISDTIWIDSDYRDEVRGWFEIDNGFFFFLDQNIAEETYRILDEAKHGVKSKKQLKKEMAASRKK